MCAERKSAICLLSALTGTAACRHCLPFSVAQTLSWAVLGKVLWGKWQLDIGQSFSFAYSMQVPLNRQWLAKERSCA